MQVESSMRRIAITGIRTFLGARLLERLEKDPSVAHIVALDVRSPAIIGEKTRFIRLDLTDPDADARMAKILNEEGIDTLVHAAFLAYPSHSSSWAHELEAIGSLYVMNAAVESRIHKLVLTSTTAVYGASPKNPAFLTEDSRLAKGQTRWISDRIGVERELARLKKDCPQMVTTSLRFGMTVGPTIRNFYTKLLSSTMVPTVLGYDPLVQYLHEDDAVSALHLAVQKDFQGAYNIVGGGTLYYSDVVRLGGKIPMPVPHLLAYPAADMLFNVELSVVPGSFLNFFRYAWVADGKKAEEEMGFWPQYSSRAALKTFYDALLEGKRPPVKKART